MQHRADSSTPRVMTAFSVITSTLIVLITVITLIIVSGCNYKIEEADDQTLTDDSAAGDSPTSIDAHLVSSKPLTISGFDANDIRRIEMTQPSGGLDTLTAITLDTGPTTGDINPSDSGDPVSMSYAGFGIAMDWQDDTDAIDRTQERWERKRVNNVSEALTGFLRSAIESTGTLKLGGFDVISSTIMASSGFVSGKSVHVQLSGPRSVASLRNFLLQSVDSATVTPPATVNPPTLATESSNAFILTTATVIVDNVTYLWVGVFRYEDRTLGTSVFKGLNEGSGLVVIPVTP